jgi:hypothetical protein
VIYPQFKPQYLQKKKEKKIFEFSGFFVCVCGNTEDWTWVFSLASPGYNSPAGLKLTILLPPPFECWDYRCVPPHPTRKIIFFGHTGVWTQGLMLAREVFLPFEPLHHLPTRKIILTHYLCLHLFAKYLLHTFCFRNLGYRVNKSTVLAPEQVEQRDHKQIYWISSYNNNCTSAYGKILCTQYSLSIFSFQKITS